MRGKKIGRQQQNKFRKMLLYTEKLWMRLCLWRVLKEKQKVLNLISLEKTKLQQSKISDFK